MFLTHFTHIEQWNAYICVLIRGQFYSFLQHNSWDIRKNIWCYKMLYRGLPDHTVNILWLPSYIPTSSRGNWPLLGRKTFWNKNLPEGRSPCAFRCSYVKRTKGWETSPYGSKRQHWHHQKKEKKLRRHEDFCRNVYFGAGKKKKHAFVMFKGRIVSKEVALRKRWETSLNVEKKLGNAGKGG